MDNRQMQLCNQSPFTNHGLPLIPRFLLLNWYKARQGSAQRWFRAG
jgi:hypothetical protein